MRRAAELKYPDRQKGSANFTSEKGDTIVGFEGVFPKG
jgi:hypothetical protein